MFPEIQVHYPLSRKALSGTPNIQQIHGPGGMLSQPGLDRAVMSTFIRSRGLASLLPVVATNLMNPIYPVFTGLTDEIGAEPDGVCDTGPVSLLTAGHLTAQFGRVIRSTPEIDKGHLAPQSAGEVMDLQFAGTTPGEGQSPLVPEISSGGGDLLVNQVRAAFFAVGYNFERKLSKLLWYGDPANNDPTKPGYLEFPGLDLQISTGNVDSLRNTPLTAVDSRISNANWGDLGTYDIVGALQDMEYHLSYLADETFGGAQYVLVMRPQLWFELTSHWPIQYNTQSVTNLINTGNVNINLNGDTMVQMRDELRRSQVLTINGKTYPVVLDNTIFEYSSATAGGGLASGEFASAIYFLPLSVAGGGITTLRWEFYDFTQGFNEVPDANAHIFVTDGGRFIWAMEHKNYCIQYTGRVEPRVVLRTPQLAGKIQRVSYHPTQHIVEGEPDSAYALARGASLQPVPARYAVWS